MKKLFLLFSLFVAFESTHAQSLAGTEWLGTNPPSPNIWFQFGTDTVYYTFTGSGFTPLSLYTSSGGIFTIADLTGTAACTSTGTYNYSYVGNSLTFTLISDNCVNRRNTLLNYTWTLIGTTGMDDQKQNSRLVVYPNPCVDGLLTVSVPGNDFTKREIILCDISGRVVYNENMEAAETRIDIGFLQHGIYTGYCLFGSEKIPFIVIR
ncbi:MAG: T9SS type A sorting domain-containing protein [Bacteroidetes bacterium]|nr:T9SS type A sorting domain-containing protein [Bacteroidota bacterium]